MKTKHILVGGLIACLFIVPKEFFFKPENFWLNMLLNTFGFVIGFVAVSLIFRNDEKEIVVEEKPERIIVEAPLPAPTKEEEYKNYMPK